MFKLIHDSETAINYVKIHPILLVGEYFVQPNLFTSAK